MGKKILLVDDSKIYQALHGEILRSSTNYELLVVSDGVEAVRQAAEFAPDLILMDVEMPKKSGIQACREIRQASETSHIPIVLLSSREEPEWQRAGLSSGCNLYMNKPIGANDLLAMVRIYLEEQ